MPADASIYGLIRQPTIEPLQSPEEREAKRMTLRNLMLQGEGAALGLQQQRDEIGTRRRIQDFLSANPNATPEQLTPIDYRAAEALRKTRLEEEAKRVAMGKDKATTGKTEAETMAALAKQGRDLIAAATPETLPAVIEWGVKNNQQWALRAPPQIMSDPAAFAQWQRQNVLGADEWLKRNAPTIAEQNTVRGQDVSAATAKAGQQVTIRGQNLVDARAREAAASAATAASAGRIPPGYRATAAGELEAIPGGPADIRAGEAGAKKATQKEALAAAAGNVLNTIREAKGLAAWTTAGPGGAAASIPMTDARKLAGHLETIKANIGFDRLQQMRDMSPTGGALGQVAVQELNSLQATIAKLDQLQHPNDLKEALGKIEQHYSRWLSTLKDQNPDQEPASTKNAPRKVIGNKRYVQVNGQWFEE